MKDQFEAVGAAVMGQAEREQAEVGGATHVTEMAAPNPAPQPKSAGPFCWVPTTLQPLLSF